MPSPETAAQPLENGVYRMRITAGPVKSDAVIVVRDGCIDGGSVSSIYQGVLTRDGTRVTAKLTVVDWDPLAPPHMSTGPISPPSVVTLTGTSEDGSFHLVGKGRHTTVIEVSGRFVAPLMEPHR